VKIIAKIHTPFREKFGIPRQSGLASVPGEIVFEKPYRNPDALRGLEDFSHLWLIFSFSESVREDFSPTVRPPRLGGNRRMGVFATRSPFRPNAIGLSCVRLEKIEQTEKGPVIHVRGADLLDGTPILDIKPYLPLADCHPEATGGFAEAVADYALTVQIPDEIKARIAPEDLSVIEEILAEDPRPSYQDDPSRIYHMDYAQYALSFTVAEGILTVTDLKLLKGEKP
jgi:tRNA-Thr(GGU) m(6)t(6)A37 methyltransferase TsaA